METEPLNAQQIGKLGSPLNPRNGTPSIPAAVLPPAAFISFLFPESPSFSLFIPMLHRLILIPTSTVTNPPKPRFLHVDNGLRSSHVLWRPSVDPRLRNPSSNSMSRRYLVCTNGNGMA